MMHQGVKISTAAQHSTPMEQRLHITTREALAAGRAIQTLLHHSNLEDALADSRRLVCYDCGVACDLSKMRDDRLVALRVLELAEHEYVVRGRGYVATPDDLRKIALRAGGGVPVTIGDVADVTLKFVNLPEILFQEVQTNVSFNATDARAMTADRKSVG